MSPGAREATPPAPAVAAGRRHCANCHRVTRQTSRRRISPAGRRLMAGAAVVTLVLYVNSALLEPEGDPAVMVLYWALPGLVGVIGLLIAAGRKGYVVECTACSHRTFRLSPPHWQAPRPPEA